MLTSLNLSLINTAGFSHQSFGGGIYQNMHNAVPNPFWNGQWKDVNKCNTYILLKNYPITSQIDMFITFSSTGRDCRTNDTADRRLYIYVTLAMCFIFHLGLLLYYIRISTNRRTCLNVTCKGRTSIIFYYSFCHVPINRFIPWSIFRYIGTQDIS